MPETHTAPLRLGLIGLAGYGGTYFKTLRGREDVTITAICDANPIALQSAAREHLIERNFADYEELLASGTTDAVCIATPHFLHYPMAMAALQANQHVFCEKPLTISAVHSDELAALARERGRVLTCHYNQRTRDYIAQLRYLVRQNLLGEVYHIRAGWLARHTEFMFDANTSWRQSRAKSGGGIFIGRGSHLIDAALHILDFPRVEAISATTSNHLAGGEVDDFATATLKLVGGASISVEATYLSHLTEPQDRMNWRIYGTRGGAEFSSATGLDAGSCAFPGPQWSDLKHCIDMAAARAATPLSILDDFIAAISEGREPFVTGEQAALITHLIEAGYHSAAMGREVVL
ncbi:putative oxidoreductase YdgJ [Abditibacteriota bacterium]|nr:putative oxidoreductase YdgJ [Abditibacteriota bacterium]